MIAETAPDFIDLTHTIEEAVGRPACARCLGVGAALSARCPGARWDYSYPRPWAAEPGDRPSAPWRVVCPRRSGSGFEVIVTHVSEADARAIAFGGNFEEP